MLNPAVQEMEVGILLNFQLLATEWQIQFLIYIALRGIPPLQGFPSFKLSLKIHPFGALLRQGISPSAEGDQGSAFGFRKPLKRLDLNFIQILHFFQKYKI